MSDIINPYAMGLRVWLRALVEEDAEGPWHTWFSDEDVTKYLNYWRPNTIERQRAFFRERVVSSGDLVLAVIDKATNHHIGIVSLSRIDWVHRFADIALVIGDKQARQKAVLGLEAFTLMLRVGFLRLNLENLKGGYADGQDHSRQILQALRFQEVGRYKDLFCIDGVSCDHVVVQLSRADWLTRNAQDMS